MGSKELENKKVTLKLKILAQKRKLSALSQARIAKTL